MSLLVCMAGRPVGTIRQTDTGRMVFDYDEKWIRGDNAVPISVSLPLDSTWHKGNEDHRFFANLLPDGPARESASRRYGVSAANDYALLARAGRECAGALSIVPEAEGGCTESLPTNARYRPMNPSWLVAFSNGAATERREDLLDEMRLSLAGAHEKWAVLVRDGRFHLPLDASPSSHILKVTNPRIAYLHINETYVTALARAVGVETVEIAPGEEYSLVTRYDRVVLDGGLQRVHQEDMCQALGYDGRTKYEVEGGPTLAQVADVIRRISVTPAADVLELIRRHVTNLLVGNSDGHAKNLSILYAPDGPRLAPAYDLVCTRAYDGFSPLMAMATGGIRDPGHIGPAAFDNLAREIAVTPRLIRRMVNEQLDRISAALPVVRSAFSAAHGDHPSLDRLDQLIRRQARRTSTLMAS
jgi:serine/threonine-protein kinase HipA